MVRGSLYTLLNDKSPIPLKIKILLLQTYVTPILTAYAGAALESLASKSQWKKLEAAQKIYKESFERQLKDIIQICAISPELVTFDNFNVVVPIQQM